MLEVFADIGFPFLASARERGLLQVVLAPAGSVDVWGSERA